MRTCGDDYSGRISSSADFADFPWRCCGLPGFDIRHSFSSLLGGSIREISSSFRTMPVASSRLGLT